MGSGPGINSLLKLPSTLGIVSAGDGLVSGNTISWALADLANRFERQIVLQPLLNQAGSAFELAVELQQAGFASTSNTILLGIGDPSQDIHVLLAPGSIEDSIAISPQHTTAVLSDTNQVSATVPAITPPVETLPTETSTLTKAVVGAENGLPIAPDAVTTNDTSAAQQPSNPEDETAGSTIYLPMSTGW